MKVRKSEVTIIQESQDTNQGAKGAGKSPRAANSSADTVEISSAAKGQTETSGRRELTSDEQAKAPKIDPENFTSLRSGADPRAALESSKPFAKYKQPSPLGNSTMPNGLSSGPDLSQYNVQGQGAPAMLKDSVGQIGSRGEQLKGLARNMTDKMNINNAFDDDQKRQEAARAAMGNNKDLLDTLGKFVKGVGEHWFGDEDEEAFNRLNRELEIEKPFQEAKAKHEKDAIAREVKRTGNLPLAPLVDPPKAGGGVKYVPPDMDGTGGSGRGGTLIDGLFNGGQILQGVTGKGPGGGEVVNPSPEATGGGKGPFDDHGRPQLSQDNADYLIGQPTEEEKGFNGLSGVNPSHWSSGGVSDGDWTGPTRIEEPGQVRTGPTGGDGSLSHLIQNNEDDDDGRK